jgi:hypothetical protein
MDMVGSGVERVVVHQLERLFGHGMMGSQQGRMMQGMGAMSGMGGGMR